MKKKQNKLRSLESLIDRTYGVRGSSKREQFELGFEAFKVGFVLEQARTKRGLTQEELAQRCGTNKSYISRIENDASDIKLSTLIKIVTTGLGGRIKLELPK
ncbi:MAG: hypothetical protein RL447_1191 [Bacteroidota bacterium]|jgi:HTH-type transcriptional regulator/antitoxin HipB